MTAAPTPMLARPVDALPGEGFLYEPKWDGVRCLAVLGRERVEMTSRAGKRLGEGFPEVVDALSRLGVVSATLDGELLVYRGGRFDFGAVLSRLSALVPDPATRAVFVVFDLLELNGEAVGALPLSARRAALEELLRGSPPAILVSPATTDPRVADQWFDNYVGPGIDGVVAKPLDSPYTPGRRTMLKRKREITVDCVVAGARPSAGGYSSLMLGLFDGAGDLLYIGAASGFDGQAERELGELLGPLETAPDGHPWSSLRGRAEWVPLRPEKVCEVASTHYEHGRLRSPARFVRWRDDREPASCRIDQLTTAIEPSRR